MIALALSTLPAAAGYPVSGRWTYDNASAAGPAPTCGGDVMTFRGEQRFDTTGGVSQFRNVSVARAGVGSFRVVDEFFNVMIRGRVSFTLSIVDEDHIMVRFDASGKRFLLRRCA